MYKITIVAGARPNFIKIAPLIVAIKEAIQNGASLSYRLVHTGQHYDANMSGSFFEQLGIPQFNTNLQCFGATQAELTADILVAFEKELITNPADLLVVVGDVTSTMACALAAKKLNTKVAHVEAGIRSGDFTMPEEINRIVTDSITDYFFTTTVLASQNLINSGVDSSTVFLVGNTMIDTLLKNRRRFFKPQIWNTIGLKPNSYFVLTMHRPANVDETKQLEDIINEILAQSKDLPIIFPVHPRTAKNLSNLNFDTSKLHFVSPMSYLEFNYLVEHAKAVITDSGGITEEATLLDVPCLTLRDNTERPETISLGTNELIGTNPKNFKPYFDLLLKGGWKKAQKVPYWDGKAADRIVNNILKTIN